MTPCSTHACFGASSIVDKAGRISPVPWNMLVLSFLSLHKWLGGAVVGESVWPSYLERFYQWEAILSTSRPGDC